MTPTNPIPEGMKAFETSVAEMRERAERLVTLTFGRLAQSGTSRILSDDEIDDIASVAQDVLLLTGPVMQSPAPPVGDSAAERARARERLALCLEENGFDTRAQWVRDKEDYSDIPIGEAVDAMLAFAQQSAPPVAGGSVGEVEEAFWHEPLEVDDTSHNREIVRKALRFALAKPTQPASVSGEPWQEEDARELALLYNHKPDDSPQFTRQQMMTAIAHGRRLGGKVGWIVSSGDGKRFRAWQGGCPCWTDNRDEAIRYARREDAEAAHEEDEDAWRIEPYALAAAPEAPAAPSTEVASGGEREAVADIINTHVSSPSLGADMAAAHRLDQLAAADAILAALAERHAMQMPDREESEHDGDFWNSTSGDQRESLFAILNGIQLGGEVSEIPEAIDRIISVMRPHDPAAIRAKPLMSFLGEAERVVNSDSVIGIFAACEWDELHDDGKQWVAGIVRETVASNRLALLSQDRGEGAGDMAAFGASEAAGYRYPGEDQQEVRAAFCAGAAHAADRFTPYRSLSECDTAAIRAVQFLEDAEDHHANCPDCEGEGVPELCETCFPLFDKARVERRLVMQSLATLPRPASGEGEREAIADIINTHVSSPSLGADMAAAHRLDQLAAADAILAALAERRMPSEDRGEVAALVERVALAIAKGIDPRADWDHWGEESKRRFLQDDASAIAALQPAPTTEGEADHAR